MLQTSGLPSLPACFIFLSSTDHQWAYHYIFIIYYYMFDYFILVSPPPASRIKAPCRTLFTAIFPEHGTLHGTSLLNELTVLLLQKLVTSRLSSLYKILMLSPKGKKNYRNSIYTLLRELNQFKTKTANIQYCLIFEIINFTLTFYIKGFLLKLYL